MRGAAVCRSADKHRIHMAGALLHRMLPRGTAARSMLKLRAASTSTATATETQQDLSYVVDRDWSEPVSPAATGGATSLRLLPINRAPETRFTVDDVAAADATRFKLHESVTFWANYATRINSRGMDVQAGSATGNSAARLTELAGSMRELIATSALNDAESAAYWAYHLGRTGFFMGLSAAGAVAHHLATQLYSLGNGDSNATGTRQRTPFENLSANATAELSNRLAEAVAMYRQDLSAIKQGQYKLPWDMTTLTHQQYNPVHVARKSVQFVSEAVATLDRRMAGGSPGNWLSSNLGYPQYYMDGTFHYQPDGWLSSKSADVYTTSTEALFFGRQDAMQRSALLALSEHIQHHGLDPSRMTLLEACCGTGRFHTFIKDNYPAMATIASDLSPFYLQEARRSVEYWAAMRGQQRQQAGTSYMHAAVESLPLPDASVDAVIVMYALHEMPEEARCAAAAELLRVLRPGGLAVLTDSVQLGDRPEWDRTLGAFGNFNEPHYRNYIACDLGALMEAAGFACGTKYVASATKTLSFTKPAAGPAAPAAAAGSDGQASSVATTTVVEEHPELN